MPTAYQPAPWFANGRAAVPQIGGQGFNWASIVGTLHGGRVSSYTPSIRGVPVTASYVRQFPSLRGLNGLGQDGTDYTLTPSYSDTINVGAGSMTADQTVTDIGTQLGQPGAVANPLGSYTIPSAPGVASSLNLQQLIQQAISNLTAGAVAASGGTYSTTPQGAVYSSSQPSYAQLQSQIGSQLSAYLPYIIIGVGIIVLVGFVGKK